MALKDYLIGLAHKARSAQLEVELSQRRAAMQREAPLAVHERTHCRRHQVVVRVGHRRWPERQLCVVQLTPNHDWAGLPVSMSASMPRELAVPTRSGHRPEVSTGSSRRGTLARSCPGSSAVHILTLGLKRFGRSDEVACLRRDNLVSGHPRPRNLRFSDIDIRRLVHRSAEPPALQICGTAAIDGAPLVRS